MKKILLITLMMVSSVIRAETEVKGNPEDLRQFLHPNDNVVTIKGNAEKKAYSDKAIVSLVITTENKLLAVAIEANSKLRNTVTKQLVQAGIAADNIKNSKFSSTPEYGWLGKKPDSYKVVNRMAVSIVKEDHLKEIATVADENPEIDFSDTAFEHTKKDEFEKQVKIDALNKIIKQKAFYEKSLGVKLATIGFRDAHVERKPTRGASRLEEVVVTARKRSESYSSKRIVQSPKEPSFDEIKYKANLAVDFKIVE